MYIIFKGHELGLDLIYLQFIAVYQSEVGQKCTDLLIKKRDLVIKLAH